MSNLAANLSHLNATSNGSVISCAQLELEAGGLVSELCSVRFAFKSIGLTLKEFVALKVIAMTSIIANIVAQLNAANRGDQQGQPDIADPASVLRIRDRYLKALISHLSHKKPPLGSGSCSSAALGLNGSSAATVNAGPNTGHVIARMNSLLGCLAQVSSAANLLLQSKMFYVPFLMNSSSITSAVSNGHGGGGMHHHYNGHHNSLSHLHHHYANGGVISNGSPNANGLIGNNNSGSVGSLTGSNSSSGVSSRSPSTSPPSSTNGSAASSLNTGNSSGTAILATGTGSN